MSAFGFRFGKKKPVDFSKMKENLNPNNNKEESSPDEAAAKSPVEDNSVDKRQEAISRPTAEENSTEPREAASQTEKTEQAQPSQGDNKPPTPKKLSGKKLPVKPLVLLALLVLFVGIAIFVIGPRLIPKIAEKIKLPEVFTKFMPTKEAEEELITSEEEAIEELVTVRTYRVARGDFIDVLPSMGNIKGDREIELRFSVNGIIDSLNFFEGDLLRKGDIVATLDQKDALLKLEYSKSKLKTQEIAEEAAKKKLQIHQMLYDDGIIIKPKLEEVELESRGAKSQKDAAQKEVEFALAELDKTYLYSPINGVMGTRDAEIGEFVTSNVKIASLYDTSTVLAEMGVIEKDISRIALGQKAKVNVDTYPGVDFEGKIENIAPIIEGKSRTLTTKIRIKNDNPRGTLLPGMFARIWISVYEKKNTIKLPSSCVYDLDNDGEFDSVYAVSDENIAKAKQVKIGYVSTDYVEIVDGLREGEQVVSEAMAELKDDVKVDVIEVQEPIL
ncbi:MAG: efflux RND transporter periplasmic adaptor subunit [Candidatus Omnitrophica bacterium]|nr:efflux RND transporter periplasmic adaptor subunit [Candidatus Omnitrophota bacterium]